MDAAKENIQELLWRGGVIAMVYEVLRVEDISKILGIKPNTIRSKSWQRRTGCPLKKIGKRLYSLPSDFESWLKFKRG